MTRAIIRKAKKDPVYALQIKRAKAQNYVAPLRRFLSQVESHAVMFDQDNNILIDFGKGDTVKDRAGRFEEPYHALVNLDMMIEIFHQVCLITLTEGLDLIGEMCADFRRKILKRLEMGLEIERSGLAQAWQLLQCMEDVFALSPIANVNLVKTSINAAIQRHEDEGKKFPTILECQEWLKTHRKAA